MICDYQGTMTRQEPVSAAKIFTMKGHALRGLKEFPLQYDREFPALLTFDEFVDAINHNGETCGTICGVAGTETSRVFQRVTIPFPDGTWILRRQD